MSNPNTPSLDRETPHDIIIAKAFMKAVASSADFALRGAPTEADKAALARVAQISIALPKIDTYSPVKKDTDEWKLLEQELKTS